MTTTNQAGFAELHGVSRKAVTTWKTRGWLAFQGDLVDIEKSNELLKKFRPTAGKPAPKSVTSPDQGNKQGNSLGNNPGTEPGNTIAAPVSAISVTVLAGESVTQAAARAAAAPDLVMTFDEARLMKEKYLGLLNQLEYDRESGLVVEVAEVTQAVGAEYAKVRTRLLSIPAEHAPRIHRMKTVTEVQDILQELITEALEELTKDGGS